MKSKRTTFDSEKRISIAPRSSVLIALAVSFFCLQTCGCDNPGLTADSSTIEVADVQPELDATNQPEEEKPQRLKRGEIPEEWKEPERQRLLPVDTMGDRLDLTFDDLKFDIEVGEAFDRSLLSEEVIALDGKEITLGGYMVPSYTASGIKGFIFVRDDKECCFGPQAAIYDCVRVYLKKGTTTNYIVRPFKVRGKFFLKEKEGPDGMIWSIFNMKNATIVQ